MANSWRGKLYIYINLFLLLIKRVACKRQTRDFNYFPRIYWTQVELQNGSRPMKVYANAPSRPNPLHRLDMKTMFTTLTSGELTQITSNVFCSFIKTESEDKEDVGEFEERCRSRGPARIDTANNHYGKLVEGLIG